MSDGNGNGFNAIYIDVRDDHKFKTGMVQYMQMLVDRTDCLPALKKKVEKHEQVYQTGKWLAIPLFALLHVLIKGLFHKLGWWE
jgi:hypothetical protein